MRTTSITIGALALLAGCRDTATAPTPAVSAARALPGEYAAVELPALPGGSLVSASAINARGQVAGGSSSAAIPFLLHATRWTDGQPEDLGTLGGNSRALGINNRGDVVGSAGIPTSSSFVAPTAAAPAIHAVRFTDRGGMEDLGTLGGARSSASAINDNGIVVGWSDLGVFGAQRAFRWTPAAGMQDLGIFAGEWDSEAVDINNRGEIVGYSGARAILWTNTGRINDLGTLPGGSYGKARAINERGEVVGWILDDAGRYHAVLWTAGREIVDLGTLPGDVSSWAVGINNAGIVVGSSQGPAPLLARRGFAWTRGEGMRELPGLPGATNTVASDINDAGMAVGGSGPLFGEMRAVRWVRSHSPVSGRTN